MFWRGSTHKFVDEQYECWNTLRPALAEHGIRVLGLHELDADARRFVDEYCEKELDPLLTPVTVDPTHPFPRVINKALCLGLLLRRRRRSALTYTGVVSVPRALPRLVRLPSEETTDFIFLADLVAHHAQSMYHGYDIVASAPFRVTRNSNLYLQEEEARNLLESVRAELHNRRKGDAVRMEIEADADPEIIERLRTVFELDPVAGISGERSGEPFAAVQCVRADAASRSQRSHICPARVAAYGEIAKPV